MFVFWWHQQRIRLLWGSTRVPSRGTCPTISHRWLVQQPGCWYGCHNTTYPSQARHWLVWCRCSLFPYFKIGTFGCIAAVVFLKQGNPNTDRTCYCSSIRVCLSSSACCRCVAWTRRCCRVFLLLSGPRSRCRDRCGSACRSTSRTVASSIHQSRYCCVWSLFFP